MLNSKLLLITPLILATTAVFADWKSNSAESTTDDQDRSAFIDLTTMIAAGDLEGAQSQVIEAATDQGVGFTKSFLEQYFPTVEISVETKEGSKPTTGILVVAPLSDQEDIENTLLPKLVHFIPITAPH